MAAPSGVPRYCGSPGCARSTQSHLWDSETCPAPTQEATAVLREAADAMREDEAGGVFLYSVAAMLLNRAERIDRHAGGALISPATPERVYADVYKVARAYLQEVGQ